MAARKKTSQSTRSGRRSRSKPGAVSASPSRRPSVSPSRHPARPVYQRIRYTATGPVITELGYKAAETIRTSGRRKAAGGSADYHLRHDLQTLRAESQAFDRDNGLYKGLVNRGLDNILSAGFSLDARTPNQRLNQKLELLWSEWGEDPEVRGLDDWASLERLALRHLWVDGDVGAIKIGPRSKTAGGRLQMIEAERIGSRTAGSDAEQLGVVLNALGRPMTFHVADYGRRGQVKSKTREISAEDFVFITNRDRISQTRGCPVMVSNFPMLHRINDVCDSEAIAWQLLSRLAIAIQQRDSDQIGVTTSLADPAAGEADLAQRYNDIGDAIVFRGEPGEDIKGIDRNIPGANFPQSITAFLRLLGLPLGMPLELVMLDWSRTNYSSARAALEQAYRMFKVWQRLLMRRWHGPIYRWKVGQWIEEGKIRARPAVFKHEWIPPPFPWLDLLKEAQAKALSIERGFATHGDVLKGENMAREDFLERRRAEIDEAITLAAKLNEEHPEANVPWEIFAGIKANIRPRETPKPVAAKPNRESKSDEDENDATP